MGRSVKLKAVPNPNPGRSELSAVLHGLMYVGCGFEVLPSTAAVDRLEYLCVCTCALLKSV